MKFDCDVIKGGIFFALYLEHGESFKEGCILLIYVVEGGSVHKYIQKKIICLSQF